MDLLLAACFADLVTLCFGVATDLRFFSGVGLASVWSPASVSSSTPAASSALSLSPVTNTWAWDPAAVFSLDLRGLAAPGVGLNIEGSAATDLRDNFLVLLLLLMADRGAWMVLAKPGTANDDLNSIAKIMLLSCHTTHLLGCFLALALALSWDKLDAGLLLAVTGPWAVFLGTSLLWK